MLALVAFLMEALTNAYSISAPKTNAIHVVIQRSIALGYDTLGMDVLDPDSWVAMVRTVVTPSEILAGTASMLIQKESQDRMTMKIEGT